MSTATISTAKRNDTSIPLYKRSQIVGAQNMLIRLKVAHLIPNESFDEAVDILNAYVKEITPEIEIPSDTCERCGGEAGGGACSFC